MATIWAPMTLLFILAFQSIISTQIAATSTSWQIPNINFRKWCQNTTHSGTCNYIIAQDPRWKLKFSPGGISTILADKANAIATAASSLIPNLLKTTDNPRAKQSLQSCSNNYGTVQIFFSSVNFSFLNHKSYRVLAVCLSKVYDEVVNCEKSNAPIAVPESLHIQNVNILTILDTTFQIMSLKECGQIGGCLPWNG